MWLNLVENYYPYVFMSERHEDVRCDLHMHISPEIVLVSRGELRMSVRGKDYLIKAGEALFIAPFEAHSFTSETSNSCHVLMFSKDLLSYMSDFLRTNQIRNHLFSPSPSLVSLVDSYLPDGRNFADRKKAAAILAPFFFEIYVNCEFRERTQPLEDRLLFALEYVNNNFNTDLTLEDVARVAGLHPVTLSKSFSSRTGTTFGFFLKVLRSSHAAALINKETLSFTEIAFRSGFGTVRSFNRAFREIYGMTPTEYKRESKKYKENVNIC